MACTECGKETGLLFGLCWECTRKDLSAVHIVTHIDDGDPVVMKIIGPKSTVIEANTQFMKICQDLGLSVEETPWAPNKERR